MESGPPNMLICSRCSTQFSTSIPICTCHCGAYLNLLTPSLFDPRALSKRAPTLWRYQEALGIEKPEHIVSLGEGFTPMIAGHAGGEPVQLKLDFLCPTGSYKDRGSTVMISKLREWGVRELVEDSSGNAGASIAAYAALAGIAAHIFVPASTSAGKTAQIEMYGARLVRVPGTREDTTLAAMRAATKVFYASHNWSPYFLAGMKTAAYEIAEQSEWTVPGWVFAPAGGGSLLAGLYLGFLEMKEAGLIASMPRLAAVQSAACDPIYRAWNEGLDAIPAVEKKPTAAEGISVAKPVRDRLILEAVRATNGVVLTVGEEDLWATMDELSHQGIYVEPTSAAAPAAVSHLRRKRIFQPQDRAVVMLTGSGLKATDKIVEHHGELETIRA
jgi:threonine synthase